MLRIITTVFNLFTKAVTKYGLPCRVISDFGGENHLVGRYMLRQRGMNRNSMLICISTHK